MPQEKTIAKERGISQIAGFYKERFGCAHSHITQKISKATRLIIVIPIYNEPDVVSTLESLNACHLPEDSVEVILVINNSEDGNAESKKQNELTQQEIITWCVKNNTSTLSFHLLLENSLPTKHAGVGLARKIGMDEALYRFGESRKNGIIACLDADCRVEKNYLTTIAAHFEQNAFTSGHLYFEHPLKNLEAGMRGGIINYELGLRYYVQALKFIKYPYAYHTIGSCIITSAKTYALSGGMNRRKAGEDFYFLHKIFPVAGHKEINSSCVYPSPRISSRVPFGTGRAMGSWMELSKACERSGKTPEYKYYALQGFLDLGKLIAIVANFWKCNDQNSIEKIMANLPEPINVFLNNVNFLHTLEDIRKQTKTEQAFIKRFYGWFDGFKILKYIHFCREYFYPDAPIIEESGKLLLHLRIHQKGPGNPEELLQQFRKLDKEG